MAQRIASKRKYSARHASDQVVLSSHPRGTPGKNQEAMIPPSRLDEDSWSFYEHQFINFARNMSLLTPWLFLVSLLVRPWP